MIGGEAVLDGDGHDVGGGNDGDEVAVPRGFVGGSHEECAAVDVHEDGELLFDDHVGFGKVEAGGDVGGGIDEDVSVEDAGYRVDGLIGDAGELSGGLEVEEADEAFLDLRGETVHFGVDWFGLCVL